MCIPTATINSECVIEARRSDFYQRGTKAAQESIERVRREMQEQAKGRHKRTSISQKYKFDKSEAEEMLQLFDHGVCVAHIALRFNTSSETVNTTIRRLKDGGYD